QGAPWSRDSGTWAVAFFFFFSSRRRHTRWPRDWSSDVCSSDLDPARAQLRGAGADHLDEVVLAPDLLLEVHVLVLEPRGEGRDRSEERRVGKECRARWSMDH